MPAPHSRDRVSSGQPPDLVKALAYTKRMASNGSQQCRHGSEDLQ